MRSACIYLAWSPLVALAFSPARPTAMTCQSSSSRNGGGCATVDCPTTLHAEPAAATRTTVGGGGAASNGDNIDISLEIPLSYNEMIQQVSQCMSDAYSRGMTRQIVRILLPRDASSGQLGAYFESEAQTSDRTKSRDMKLVPTDESWQGGIMQLYRAASPTAKDILKQLSPTAAATGVPPIVIEDRTIDESGVDGVGLLYTQTGMGSESQTSGGDSANGDSGFGSFFGGSLKLPNLSSNDMCVFVQPTQEVADAIEDVSSKPSSGSQLIALLNPQWRSVDDALDSASKSDGVFGALASFLGGKGSVLRQLDDLGYCPTYSLEGYVCKGGNIRLIKRFDSDWIVFAENDAGNQYVRLGTTLERPSYQEVEKMLDDRGVGYKYARDLGMSPKL